MFRRLGLVFRPGSLSWSSGDQHQFEAIPDADKISLTIKLGLASLPVRQLGKHTALCSMLQTKLAANKMPLPVPGGPKRSSPLAGCSSPVKILGFFIGMITIS